MKKIIYQALALAMTLSLSSCFSDDSSLSSNDVGDITISGISDSYSQVAYMGETLDITPTVESQEDVTYSWLLLNSTTGSKDKDGNEIQPEVIGHEKDLHYEVNLSPGTYQVRLVAQGKSGYTVYKRTSLTVRTTFSQGFYVLKETTDGNSDVDLITKDGKTGYNIIASMDGEALHGKPLSMGAQYNAYYVNPDNDQMEVANMLYVTTESGDFRVKRTTDFKTAFSRNNVMYGTMENSEFPYAFFNGSISNCMLTNHGFYKSKMPYSNSNPSTGQYGMPVSECGGSRYFFTDIDSYGGGVLWDAQNHNLLAYGYGLDVSPLLYENMTGSEETQNLANYECLSCGYNRLPSGATGVVIMRDNATAKRYIYLTEGSFQSITLTARKPLREGSHAANASYYGINGVTASYLYCVDAGRLYAMNFKDDDMGEIEVKPEGIPAGETINFVANQFWNPALSGGTPFDYLIVGTQKGNTYKLYFYDTNGGAPVGKPLMTMEGTGKVKCVRFINTNYSSNDMQFGYLTFNNND